MNGDLHGLANELNISMTPEEFFGVLGGRCPKTDKLIMLKAHFRYTALIVHEDHQDNDGDRVVARSAFIKLKALYEEAVRRVENDTYGTRVPLASLKTKRDEYQIIKGIATGDLAALYLASGKTNDVVLKIVRDQRDNDLMQREAEVVASLQKRVIEAGLRATGDFIPRLVESAVVRIKGQDRRVNVFERSKDELIPLTELASYFPNGVDQAHFVWIFRRLLTTLGFAHSLGVIHGAVLPTHVLINPKNHGIQLIDWCYSGPINAPIHAISTEYQNWYPPEVLPFKRPATTATDIFMAAKTMSYILGADINMWPKSIHPAFTRFLETCLWPNPDRRPQDAWELHDQFSKITKSVLGPRKFIELVLPR